MQNILWEKGVQHLRQRGPTSALSMAITAAVSCWHPHRIRGTKSSSTHGFLLGRTVISQQQQARSSWGLLPWKSKLALLVPGVNSAVQKYKLMPVCLIPKDAETADQSWSLLVWLFLVFCTFSLEETSALMGSRWQQQLLSAAGRLKGWFFFSVGQMLVTVLGCLLEIRMCCLTGPQDHSLQFGSNFLLRWKLSVFSKCFSDLLNCRCANRACIPWERMG